MLRCTAKSQHISPTHIHNATCKFREVVDSILEKVSQPTPGKPLSSSDNRPSKGDVDGSSGTRERWAVNEKLRDCSEEFADTVRVWVCCSEDKTAMIQC